MTRQVLCKKLNIESEGLDFQPYPGELGQRIYDTISKAAWQQWLQHQTMLINEYRLNALEAKAREFLEAEMVKFLFGEGSEKPQGFSPPTAE